MQEEDAGYQSPLYVVPNELLKWVNGRGRVEVRWIRKGSNKAHLALLDLDAREFYALCGPSSRVDGEHNPLKRLPGLDIGKGRHGLCFICKAVESQWLVGRFVLDHLAPWVREPRAGTLVAGYEDEA